MADHPVLDQHSTHNGRTTSDDPRARILNAAGAVFAEKGFDRATIRDICKAAGVNLAGVNYYFGDKQRLYIETVKHAHRLQMEHVPLPAWAAGMAPEDKLRQFVRTMLGRMLGSSRMPWQTQLMLREIASPTAACKEMVDEYIRPQFQLLLGILNEMLPPDTPAHRREQLAFSVVGQCLHYRVAGEVVALLIEPERRETHFSVDRLAEHISGLVLAAIGRTPPWPASFDKSSADHDARGY
jgi:AcrR family transcriptional regulator